MIVRLGDKVEDTLTGFKGTVVSITDWLYGCRRIAVQAYGLDKDGKPFDYQVFDEPSLIVVEDVGCQDKEATGGVRSIPSRRRDAR